MVYWKYSYRLSLLLLLSCEPPNHCTHQYYRLDPTRLNSCAVWFHRCVNESSSTSEYLILGRALGDEIIEWNGRSLHGRSAQEVNDIVTDIGNDFHQIELIVSRPLVLAPSDRTSSQQRSSQQSGRRSYSPFRYTRGICPNLVALVVVVPPILLLLLFLLLLLIPNNKSQPKTDHDYFHNYGNDNRKHLLGWVLRFREQQLCTTLNRTTTITQNQTLFNTRCQHPHTLH